MFLAPGPFCGVQISTSKAAPELQGNSLDMRPMSPPGVSLNTLYRVLFHTPFLKVTSSPDTVTSDVEGVIVQLAPRRTFTSPLSTAVPGNTAQTRHATTALLMNPPFPEMGTEFVLGGRACAPYPVHWPSDKAYPPATQRQGARSAPDPRKGRFQGLSGIDSLAWSDYNRKPELTRKREHA